MHLDKTHCFQSYVLFGVHEMLVVAEPLGNFVHLKLILIDFQQLSIRNLTEK